jgi:hypothetical protein
MARPKATATKTGSMGRSAVETPGARKATATPKASVSRAWLPIQARARIGRVTPGRPRDQSKSLPAISATRLPWKAAPSSSCSEGQREPSESVIAVAP